MLMETERIQKQYSRMFAPHADINLEAGWCWLVAGLCQSLEMYTHNNHVRAPLLISGIYQRLGSLCIDYHGGDTAMETMIGAVQLASNSVCQSCASTTNVGTTFGPGLYTLCRDCWARDPNYRLHHLNPNVYSELAFLKIEKGIGFMPGGWFRNRLIKLLSE